MYWQYTIIALNRPYSHSRVQLGSNDKLVFYTDGVTEAMDREGNIFTEERLEKIITGSCKDLTVKASNLLILDNISRFADGADQSDDITLLMLSYQPSKKSNPSTPDQHREIFIKNDLSELERMNAFLEDSGIYWGIGSDLLFRRPREIGACKYDNERKHRPTVTRHRVRNHAYQAREDRE